MPLLPYMISINLSPSRLIQAINCSFTFSSILMAVGLANLELMTLGVVTLSIVGLIPVYLGTKMGGKIRGRITSAVFRNLVILLLTLTGIVLIVQSIL